MRQLQPDEIDRIAALPTVEAFCGALLEIDPKATSGDLAEAANAIGKFPHVRKADARRIRESWKAAREATSPVASAARVDEETPRHTTRDMLRELSEQLHQASLTGDGKAVASLANAMNLVSKLTLESESKSTEDWSRLTELECACLAALIGRLNGAGLDDDGTWWIGYVNAAPEKPRTLHPSRLPLNIPPRPTVLEIPAETPEP